LLGLRRGSVDELVVLFRAIIATPVEPDGLVFGEVSAEPIRAAMETGGIRVILRAELASARVTVQVDVGFGDATVPPPVEVEFPTLLGSPKPKLRAYPPETVIAEKLEAMVRLGLGNSRMKDFFDIWHLSRTFSFEETVLAAAIRATFAARNTPLPTGPITALSADFAADRNKQTQWVAFVRQAAVAEQTPDLPAVVTRLREFLEPLMYPLNPDGKAFARWTPGHGWK